MDPVARLIDLDNVYCSHNPPISFFKIPLRKTGSDSECSLFPLLIRWKDYTPQKLLGHLLQMVSASRAWVGAVCFPQVFRLANLGGPVRNAARLFLYFVLFSAVGRAKFPGLRLYDIYATLRERHLSVASCCPRTPVAIPLYWQEKHQSKKQSPKVSVEPLPSTTEFCFECCVVVYLMFIFSKLVTNFNPGPGGWKPYSS